MDGNRFLLTLLAEAGSRVSAAALRVLQLPDTEKDSKLLDGALSRLSVSLHELEACRSVMSGVYPILSIEREDQIDACSEAILLRLRKYKEFTPR